MLHPPPFAYELPALNLGNGSWSFAGWTNADIVKQWPGYRPADVVCDAREPLPFEDGEFRFAYLGHLLQHLAPRYHKPCLQEIHRVLQPGSTLLVTEVEIDEVMRRFLADPADHRLAELIWGELGEIHGDDLVYADSHNHGFTEQTLRDLIVSAGFKEPVRERVHPEITWYDLSERARRP